jgi:hypothetical protein
MLKSFPWLPHFPGKTNSSGRQAKPFIFLLLLLVSQVNSSSKTQAKSLLLLDFLKQIPVFLPCVHCPWLHRRPWVSVRDWFQDTVETQILGCSRLV